MGKSIDLTNKRFGKLVAIKYSHTINKKAFWVVKCDCGVETTKMAKYLLNGDTKSCGCILARDGRTKTRIYSIWASMMTRCYNKKRRSYKDYGGRGIIVCEHWHDFKNFYEDTKVGYSDELTLDRYPNRDGNYEPGNTRWATAHEQAKNKDRTKLYLYNGQMLCVPEIAKLTGLTAYSIYGKLAYGIPFEEAVAPKISKYGRRTSTYYNVYGKPKTIKDLSMEYNISYNCLRDRIKRNGWTVYQAIGKPAPIAYSFGHIK